VSRSLTPADFIAQAACLRVVQAIREETHLFCQELPPMNVERFLKLLSACRLPVEKVSVTLVGYCLSDSDLQSLLDRLGLSSVGHASTDLHVAAAWRNRPEPTRSSLRLLLDATRGSAPLRISLKEPPANWL
jgi:hypothetical protein